MRLHGPLLMLFAAAMLCGCQCIHENSLTGKLWDSGSFDRFYAPDRKAAMSVYYDARTDDYFAVYMERSAGSDKPRLRMYRLGEGLDGMAKHEKPKFASVETNGLTVIPVNASRTVVPRAVVDNVITIYTAEGPYGPFPLPQYKTGRGTVIKTALTPLAVTGDVTIFALILGIASIPSALGSVANIH